MIYFMKRRRYLLQAVRQSTFLKLGLLSIITGIYYFTGFISHQRNGIKDNQNEESDINIVAASTNFGNQLDIKITEDQDFDDLNEDSEIKDNLQSLDFIHLRNTTYPGVETYTLYTTARLNLKPLSGVKPLRPDFGPVLNDVISFNYSIQVKPCPRTHVKAKHTIFVAIVSAPDYFSKRKTVRQTWLPHLKVRSKIVSEIIPVGIAFVLGLTKNQTVQSQIEEESEEYGDIIQMDIMDDYFNLTQKTIGIVNWLNSYCSSVDFVLKVDDDTFMNVRNLESAVMKLNSSELAIYGGYCTSIAEREGKFSVSYEEWPWTQYPTYISGNMALLAGKAIGSLLAAAQTIPFLPFEDSYLYGVCSEKAGIQLYHSDSVKISDYVKNPCQFYDTLSFLTDTEDIMMEYHLATEDFYKNVTHCVVVGSDGVNRTVNPTERFNFDFQLSLVPLM